EKFDVVVRYQGGDNAGHTVVVGSTQTVFNLLPSAMFHPGKKCILGNGMVINPEVLNREIERVGNCLDRLVISSQAHLIMPWHLALEQARTENGQGHIGTTGRGIGLAYESKAARGGLRAGDLLEDGFEVKMRQGLENANRELVSREVEPLDRNLLPGFLAEAKKLAPFVQDTALLINELIDSGRSVLFEGAQGAMLDIDHGTYPYVTSSSTNAGGACTGTGVAPTLITGTLAVVKAYTTRVGGGPFPTEPPPGDLIGDYLQSRGREIGARTGRKRRCGWLDIPVLRRSAMLNRPEALAITKLDVLDELPEIKICVGYTLRGSEIKTAPASAHLLAVCRPVYQTIGGWLANTSGITDFDKLPYQAQKYIFLVEELCGRPVTIVSTGPDRNETIIRKDMRVFEWMDQRPVESQLALPIANG
ncbi:MAG: adenylosuccinate synthase, partial [Candidatus Doudnabacteria bacterium]|nr:adenylosuccinate synthase [Candidatus Doudnabacteria bacterium]